MVQSKLLLLFAFFILSFKNTRDEQISVVDDGSKSIPIRQLLIGPSISVQQVCSSHQREYCDEVLVNNASFVFVPEEYIQL